MERKIFFMFCVFMFSVIFRGMGWAIEKNAIAMDVIDETWIAEDASISPDQPVLITAFINEDILTNVEHPVSKEYIFHKYLYKMISHTGLFTYVRSLEEAPLSLEPESFTKNKDHLVISGKVLSIETFAYSDDEPIEWGSVFAKVSISFVVMDSRQQKVIIKGKDTENGMSIDDCVEKLCSDMLTFLYSVISRSHMQ